MIAEAPRELTTTRLFPIDTRALLAAAGSSSATDVTAASTYRLMGRY
jgi:hypothetical protein